VTDTELGTAELATGGGGISAENLKANKLSVKTGGGGIRIFASCRETEAVCGGGSINLTLRDARSVSAKTGGGGVGIQLKDAEGVDAELSTAGGMSELTWKGERLAARRRITLTVGDGSVKVSAKSGGGSVRLAG
jgi:DUF4097 and DUF4098 domain-containing protein YvlB